MAIFFHYLNHLVNVQETHDPQTPFKYFNEIIYFPAHEVILAKLKLLLRCQELKKGHGDQSCNIGKPGQI